VDSDLARSHVHASGESQLVAGYPTRADLSFANVRYVNIAPFLNLDDTPTPSFDALMEGKASVNGPILKVNALVARLELSRLEMQAATRASSAAASAAKTVGVKNDGPIMVSLKNSVAKVDQFRLRGAKTSVDVSGAINLADDTQPLQIKVNGNTDLGILQDVSRKLYSSGNIAVNASIGGTFAEPLLNGKVELQRVNVNSADVPNGLENGNGVILLQGTTAIIQNLTGESGGGKVSASGFVGLTPKAVVYNLYVHATGVRTRYSGVSLTSSGNIALTGNSRRSLLSGTVSVDRVAYSSSSDIGSILNTASTPPSTDATPSPLLESMRLDVRVSSAPDIRIVTSYVERLDLKSALTLRGTAAEPGIVGYINVTDGQLAFFGNTYTVNRGSIKFYDPSAIRPELDLSLETLAQGVDVTLDVTGPINRMNLSYRSDPPLSFEQIVELLATNTTPNDPTIAAHQPTPPPQTMTQMGESAVLGQAIASPLASRVQRVFGLTQLKIDPSVTGNNGQPTAKVTLQQKIANNITFTYITDVTQSNSEIVRIQWDLSPKTSAVALRDYNGNVSIEMFYKFQVR
jgi:translocation and assembly module TamB